MPCPPLPSGLIPPYPVQTVARVGFEIVHDPLRPSLAFDHDVNMAAAHVRGKHAPVAVGAVIEKRGQDCLTPLAVRGIRRLAPQSAFPQRSAPDRLRPDDSPANYALDRRNPIRRSASGSYNQ